MQRYRINYLLLISLAVGSLVGTVLFYYSWRYQKRNLAGKFLVEAQAKDEEGKTREAFTLYGRYCRFKPGNEKYRIRFAELSLEILKRKDAEEKDYLIAARMAEKTTQDFGANSDFRRKVVDFYAKYNPTAALSHLKTLLKESPNDIKLLRLQLKALIRNLERDEAEDLGFKLIGYDPSTRKFDVKAGTDVHHIENYFYLAALLQNGNADLNLAGKIIEQLVLVNPDSAIAHNQRSLYYRNLPKIRKTDETKKRDRESAERAYELDPKDQDVRYSKIYHLIKDEEYDKAIVFLESTIKEFPEVPRFYLLGARIATNQEDIKGALAWYQRGIKAVKINASKAHLLFVKLETMLSVAKQLKIPADQIDQDYLRYKGVTPTGFWKAKLLGGLIEMFKGNYAVAARDLELLRLNLAGGKSFSNSNIMSYIDNSLAQCYEALGQKERALAAYRLVLEVQPGNLLAKDKVRFLRLQIGLQALNKSETSVRERTLEEMAKPVAERDWEKVERFLEGYAERMGLDKARAHLIRAESYVWREEHEKAKKEISAAHKIDPHNLRIRIVAIKLLQMNPELGSANPMRLLHVTVREFGDSPLLRMLKANIILQTKGKDVRKEFFNLFENTTDIVKKGKVLKVKHDWDEWSVGEKSYVYQGVAELFFALNMQEDAKFCWTEVTKLLPKDLKARERLFQVAYVARDNEEMLKAQEEILKIVQTKEDSVWIYCEVRRQLLALYLGRAQKDILPGLRLKVNVALRQRPNWQELHKLQRDISYALGNEADAIRQMELVRNTGRADSFSLKKEIFLLASREQYLEARKIANEIQEDLRPRMLGRVYAEILYHTHGKVKGSNDIVKALRAAGSVVDRNPENPRLQIWFGRFVLQIVRRPEVPKDLQKEYLAKVGVALNAASERLPDEQESWLMLVLYYAQLKDLDSARQALLQARLALAADRASLVEARSYEFMGRVFDAENSYVHRYQQNPNDLATLQHVAKFYLGPVYRKKTDSIDKATIYLNKIFKAVEDGSAKANAPEVLWARRKAAAILINTHDYQNALKAENTLSMNFIDGKLPLEDQLLLVRVLSSRPEPIARSKAILLIEHIAKQQPLPLDIEQDLARLYMISNKWDKCNKQMLKLMSKDSSPQVRRFYISLLLQQMKKKPSSVLINTAQNQVKLLLKAEPRVPVNQRLMVRVAAESGDVARVKVFLLRLLPNNLTNLKENELARVTHLADLFSEIDDYKNAEKCYRALAKNSTEMTFRLINYYGTEEKTDKAFQLLESQYKKNPTARVTEMAIHVLTLNRYKVADFYDEKVELWLGRLLREDPDSVRLQLQQMDFFDLQERYDEVTKIQKELLVRSDLTKRYRAIILNNRSFLLALSSQDLDEAHRLIEKAVFLLGPRADILDTRGVVYIARKEYEKAATDLQYSVFENPTASKFFHLTQAYLGLNKNKKAVEAWKSALQFELSEAKLNQLERNEYKKVEAKIKALSGS